MNAQKTVTVHVSHSYKAPAQQIYDAFLTPEIAGKFMFVTPDGTMMRSDIDARVGGRFTFTERRDGEDIEHTGTYIELSPPRRIVFDFLVPKYTTESTRISIDITPDAGKCSLILTHEGVWADYADKTKAGWSGILDRLAGLVQAV